MKVTKTRRHGRECWLVKGAGLEGRPYAGLGWYIYRREASVIAEVPTGDGEDWQEIVVNERNEPEMEAYWRSLDSQPLKLAAAVRREINGRAGS